MFQRLPLLKLTWGLKQVLGNYGTPSCCIAQLGQTDSQKRVVLGEIPTYCVYVIFSLIQKSKIVKEKMRDGSHKR
jgi:hypothetical protein